MASPTLMIGGPFYGASAILLVLILQGLWLEMRARADASKAIRALMDMAPPKAFVLRDGRAVGGILSNGFAGSKRLVTVPTSVRHDNDR